MSADSIVTVVRIRTAHDSCRTQCSMSSTCYIHDVAKHQRHTCHLKLVLQADIAVLAVFGSAELL